MRRFAAILLVALATPASAFVHHGRGGGVPPSAPTNNGGQINLPEIVGNDTVGSTLYARMGNWTGMPTPTFTCSWHLVGGSSLGSNCASFPLISGYLGSYVQVDVTATNTGGSQTVFSDVVGPVENVLPPSPPVGPGTAPTSLPTWPMANVLQNGHAVPRGCTPPSDVPPNTATTGNPLKVWYFDPIGGQTIAGGATGHAGSPFKDLSAFYTSVAGYTASPLFGAGRTILPGDTIYVKNGDATHVLGPLDLDGLYSTTTGLSSGTDVFTWILADPTSLVRPVLRGATVNNGSAFIVQNFGIEETALDLQSFSLPAAIVNISGSTSNPVRNIYIENNHIGSWPGHSGTDPWSNSPWPNSGGTSRGDITTASPSVGAFTNGQGQNSVTALSVNATKLFLNDGIPNFTAAFGFANLYVWSPGYYLQQKWPTFPNLAPSNTGIPNGTVIKDLNGITTPNIKGNVATSASLPATAVINDAWFAVDTKHVWYGTTGPVWTDMGLGYVTIGPCGTVTDASTGCPSALTNNGTPFAGVDPVVQGSGGCTGTCPLWNGTTRAITNEYVDFTQFMRVTPAGGWNHVDANYALQGISIVGSLNASPNDVRGATCISLKYNTIRNVWSTIKYDRVTDVVAYGNRSKWRNGDWFQILSSHRTGTANNYGSDSTFLKEHQDCIQYAQNGSLPNNAEFYGNYAVNNECYGQTDPNNPFMQFTQSFGVTDQIYSGTTYDNNVVFNSNNPMIIAGQFNVMVHNDSFMDSNGGPGVVQVLSGRKVNTNQPANSMMANNLANSTNRNNGVAGIATNCAVDLNTVETNMNVPVITATGVASTANSTFCNNSGGVGNSSQAGSFPDMKAWAPVDYRTNSANPLFAAFNMISPNASPDSGGGIMMVNSCLRNEWPVGTCGLTDPGRLDLRPNASFVPTTGALTNQVGTINSMPTTGAIGDRNLLASASTCGNGITICGGGNDGLFDTQTFPAGVYTRATASTNMSGYGSSMGFTLLGSGFGASQGTGGVTVGGVAATIASWSPTQITGTLGPTSHQLDFTITGSGYGTTSGTLVINGVTAHNVSWSNTAVSGIMPLGAPFPTAGNTVINLSGGGTGVFGTATLNVVQTNNGGGSGTITFADAQTFNPNNGAFSPGIIGAGTNLGPQQPPVNHARRAWTNPPNIGAY